MKTLYYFISPFLVCNVERCARIMCELHRVACWPLAMLHKMVGQLLVVHTEVFYVMTWSKQWGGWLPVFWRNKPSPPTLPYWFWYKNNGTETCLISWHFLHSQTENLPCCFMQAICSCLTMVAFYQSPWCCNLEDCSVYLHCCGNFEFHIKALLTLHFLQLCGFLTSTVFWDDGRQVPTLWRGVHCQCPQDMQWITAIVLRICSGLL